MGAPPSWPLIGRDADLATIEGARHHSRAGVIVSGAVGMGKSRLAAEAMRSAARDGAPTARIVATETATEVPLSAFVVLLPPGTHDDDLFVTMQRTTEGIARASRGRPLVLVVEDAQWLDAASAVLLHHLVVAEVVFVIATVRDDGPLPGAIASIWKDTDAVRIDLGGLDGEQTATLAAEVLRGPIDHVLRRWLSDSTRGNPLYIRELLTQAERDGAVISVEGVWTLQGAPQMAPSLQELLTARTAALSAPASWTLSLLALGEPLGVTELTDDVGGDALLELESRGLIDVDEDAEHARVRLAHPMYAQSVRQGLKTLNRRRAAKTLARLLMAREHPEPGDTLRTALLLIESGEEPPSDLLLEAAEEANRTHVPRVAAELAARVRSRAAGGARASLALSRALIALRRHAEALEVLGAAEAALDTPEVAAEYLELNVELLYWGMRDAPAARDLLGRAAQWWPGDDWRRRLEPLRLRTLAFETARTADSLDDLIATLASAEDDDELRLQLEPLRAASLLRRGRVQEAYALSTTWADLPEPPGMTAVIARAVRARAVLDSGIGWASFEAETLFVLERCVDSHDAVGAGQAAYALSALRRAQGRYRDARTFAVEAELRLREEDPFGVLPVVVCLQAEYACFTGKREDARRLLVRAERLCGSEPLVYQAPFLARARAWAVYAEGDEMRAQRMLVDAAAETAQPLYASGLYHEALRAGAPPREVAGRLAALRGASDSPFSHLYADEARAAADDDGAGLWELIGAYEQIGGIRDAADAAALAASAFARTGRLDSARRAAARSRSLIPADQGATAPRSVALDGVAVTLTRRERQIAQLASEGYSSAEIAERLAVSVRTVESHLYRAMQKVGATDRRDIRLG